MNAMAIKPQADRALSSSQLPSFLINALTPKVSSIEVLEHSLEPQQIACITCMDFRELPRHGYTLSCAGAIAHDEIISGLSLVLPKTKLLVLRAHTDCAKSKAEVERRSGESDDNYSARVEARTLERLWESAITLLQDHNVSDAIKNGMVFCMELLDVETRQIEYLEAQSISLIKQVCGEIYDEAA